MRVSIANVPACAANSDNGQEPKQISPHVRLQALIAAELNEERLSMEGTPPEIASLLKINVSLLREIAR